MRAEVSKLEEQVLEGYQQLVVLRNSLIQTEDEQVRTEGLGTRVLDRDRAPEGRAGRLRTRKRCRGAKRSSGSRRI